MYLTWDTIGNQLGHNCDVDFCVFQLEHDWESIGKHLGCKILCITIGNQLRQNCDVDFCVLQLGHNFDVIFHVFDLGYNWESIGT